MEQVDSSIAQVHSAKHAVMFLTLLESSLKFQKSLIALKLELLANSWRPKLRSGLFTKMNAVLISMVFRNVW